MLAREYLLLEDFSPPALVDTSDLEDLGGIYIRVCAPAHDGDASDHALIDLWRWRERVSKGMTRPCRIVRDEARLRRDTHLDRGIDGIVYFDGSLLLARRGSRGSLHCARRGKEWRTGWRAQDRAALGGLES